MWKSTIRSIVIKIRQESKEVEYLWCRSNYDGIHRRVGDWLAAVVVYRNRLSGEEMTKGMEGCFPTRVQQKQQSMKCKKNIGMP